MLLSKSYRLDFVYLHLENKDPQFTFYILRETKYKLNCIWQWHECGLHIVTCCVCGVMENNTDKSRAEYCELIM